MVTLILIVLGVCMGSFVEATSWRLHEQAKGAKKRSKRAQRDLSIVQGRSMCASCKHTLAWYDLVPLVSWLSLRGKCRYCHARIGWHAPVLELAAAALFVLSYAYWPHVLTGAGAWAVFALWLLAVVPLLLLTVYDLRWMLLPNRVVYPLQVIALAYAVGQIAVLGLGAGAIVSLVLAVVVLAGLFWLLYAVSGGQWIGDGDVRLGVALGLLAMTPLKAGLVLFFASLLGSFVGVPFMLLSKQGRKARIPFGPFLIAATFIVVLFGATMIEWYKQKILFITP